MKHPHRPRCYYMRVRRHGEEAGGDTAPRIRHEMADLDSVLSHHERFTRRFPSVTPSYSVGGQKCNVNADLVRAVSSSENEGGGVGGVGFSCRSIEALRLVAAATTTDDEESNRSRGPITYSSPCKSKRHIVEAHFDHGVRRMTVESVAEVVRISTVSKDIELVLCISPGEEESQNIVVRKQQRPNGAPREKWRGIMEAAVSRGMKVVGVAFRLEEQDGDEVQEAQAKSNCLDVVLKRAREAFNLAQSDDFGFVMEVVDVGAALVPTAEDSWQLSHRCSTVVESDEAEAEECPIEDVDQRDAVRNDSTTTDELLLKYFPPADSIAILAEPAEYTLPDEAVAVKWWGTPKVRRSAPSLYAYLTQGATGADGRAASIRIGPGYHRCFDARQIREATPPLSHSPLEVAAAQA